jgi:transcription elongation factor GreB
VSKAFTREDSDSDNFAPTRAPLPPGTQNYITPAGAARIKSELTSLLEKKRAAADGSAPQSEQQALDGRIQYLQALANTLVIVEPAPSDVVRFGATVTLKRSGQPETYTIVGVDEIDLDRNHISWLSPLARALMSRRAGDRVIFKSPAGPESIEITAIH